MFENFCALLLRLYPPEFRRAYGHDAVQLIRDRARNERGALLRIRLLIDLASDLGAISLQGWEPRRPSLARIDGAPRFDIIDIPGPRPVVLAAGMAMSILMFASFTLLFQPKVPWSTSSQVGGGSGRRGGTFNNSGHQPAATGPKAHHKQPADPRPAKAQVFEEVSIKLARSGDSPNFHIRVMPNGDLTASAVPVLFLLSYAYDVPVNPSPRLSGLPVWRDTYNIEAKASANAIPADLSAGERQRRMQGMVRGLLADRFRLVMRVEQKTMSVYALAVASGGPNLLTSTIAEKDCTFDTGAPESCHHFVVGRGHPLNAKAINMTTLRITSRTGQTGRW